MNYYLLGHWFGENKMLVKAKSLKKAKAIYKKWYNEDKMACRRILSCNIEVYTLGIEE